MKRLLSITVKGQTKEWALNFYGNPRDLEKWREDGLEVNEIVNKIPGWVADIGLARPWVFFQDLFNFNLK